jgi:uncharacterized iron-regulated protein
MKYYIYVEPTGSSSEPTYTIMSEKAILVDYWKYWTKRMLAANKELDYSDIEGIQRHCVEDFCTVHWATELDLESATEWIKNLLEPT